jgi:hypothetical protein
LFACYLLTAPIVKETFYFAGWDEKKCTKFSKYVMSLMEHILEGSFTPAAFMGPSTEG